MKIALVVSDFNFDVTSLMLERGRRHAEFLGAEVSQVVHVPGSLRHAAHSKTVARAK